MKNKVTNVEIKSTSNNYNDNLNSKLDTIQKYENLNSVFSIDQSGPGGAHHEYAIYRNSDLNDSDFLLNVIKFQKGPRKEKESIIGILDSDLLEIVRDRLKSFQEGPFASDYNNKALKGVEMALIALNQRVEDRINRNVLGENKQ